MSFRQKHRPEHINDLVFRDPRAGQIIADYAAGVRTKHLLLHGPTSTGKSEAARLILKERLLPLIGPAYSSIYNGKGFNSAMIEKIDGDWNMQSSFAGSAFSVIDEVDRAGLSGLHEICKFIDDKSFGTLICTTNHLHKLDASFLSRFYVVKVDPPLPTDWYPRAVKILQAEGHAVTVATVQTLFANFSGHARDFMDLVEDADIELRRNKQATVAHPIIRQAAKATAKSTTPSISLSNALNGRVKVTASKSGNTPTP